MINQNKVVTGEVGGAHTSHLDDLSLQGDHPPTLVLLEGHPGGLLHVLGHQGVPQGEVESWPHTLLLHTHHVEETRGFLGSADGSHVSLPHLHLGEEMRR